ncbi:MAG: hypothetical protein IJY14_01960 [Acholeplasmatales bacterium]|nr:hypothetical protein [Acholeplasmatales bacterium]
MSNLLKSVNELVNEAQAIVEENFDSIVNTRAFEIKIDDLTKKFKLTKNSNSDAIEANNDDLYINDIIQKIDENLNINKELAFVLFFTLFTKIRKTKLSDLEKFKNEYIKKFDYKICKFIDLLCSYNVDKSDENISRLVVELRDLIKEPEFINHQGLNNFYVELICTYFENNIDTDIKNDKDKYLKEAKKKIEAAIASSTDSDCAYPKFYLNHGRVLILMGEYGEGENSIIKGIQNIKSGPDRESTAREYEQYLIKSSIIRTSEEIKKKNQHEIEDVKLDSLKTITLITTLLSFILGSISIFAEVKDTFTLAMLLMSYLGLVLILAGIVLIGIRAMYKKSINLKSIKYEFFITVLGVIIITSAMLIILL